MSASKDVEAPPPTPTGGLRSWGVHIDSRQNKPARTQTEGAHTPILRFEFEYAPPAILRAFLASNPVLNGSFQTHDRFGWLEFAR